MSIATEPVNTKKVTGRRTVHYGSHAEVLEDAERLAQADVQTVGNWSRGQIYRHLAMSLDSSIDGDKLFPAPMRMMLNLLFKKKFLAKGIPSGFKSPAKFVPTDNTTIEEGLDDLRRAIARQHEVAERAPHPGFGKFSRAEWDQFHYRHAEMHMSFIVENV